MQGLSNKGENNNRFQGSNSILSGGYYGGNSNFSQSLNLRKDNAILFGSSLINNKPTDVGKSSFFDPDSYQSYNLYNKKDKDDDKIRTNTRDNKTDVSTDDSSSRKNDKLYGDDFFKIETNPRQPETNLTSKITNLDVITSNKPLETYYKLVGLDNLGNTCYM